MFTVEELQALGKFYLSDMKKRGYTFITDNITFNFDNSSCNCGTTSFKLNGYKIAELHITVSKRYADRCSLSQLRNTILHELCHCLTGTEEEQHGKAWKTYAKKASRDYNTEISAFATNEESNIMHEANKYTILCPKCGVISSVARMTKERKLAYERHTRICTACKSVVTYRQNY